MNPQWNERATNESRRIKSRGYFIHKSERRRYKCGVKLSAHSAKCVKYWQSLIRFGFPFIILYGGIDYGTFRLTAGKAGLPYDWRTALIFDVPVMFIVAALWCGITREVVAAKRKSTRNCRSLRK